MLAAERSLPETDPSAEDPYAHVDTAADGTLYPHNPRALLARYWLDAGGHIKLDAIESYLSASNTALRWELEWCQRWLGHVSGECDNTPASRYPYLCRQFPAWECCEDARPGIDEVFRRDAMASKRHGFVPFYESNSKPICKVRFSEWISEGPLNCAKGSMKDELAECDVDSGCAESEDEWWYECEDEKEKERDQDTDEGSERSDQWSEATEGTSLGEEDGERNDSAETHGQPGPRQLAGPAGTEKFVLISERKGRHPHFDALQCRAAEKARLEAMGCGFSNLAIRLKRPGIRGDGEKQNEEHHRERLERTSSP